MATCIRRALCFPYLRHFGLAKKVLEDVCTILALGRRVVLRCLLALKQIIAHDENKYVLNKLFIDDYCVWIQKVSKSKLKKFSKSVSKMFPDIDRESVGFPLVELEQLASNFDSMDIDEDGEEQEEPQEEEDMAIESKNGDGDEDESKPMGPPLPPKFVGIQEL
eukprot:TRINITY_DN9149_c0_g1_i1.p1 TRINITY_DN9149_c0_g1~~TRINITY_DN9149_c0_g1_i1.p1  ORF type:complete len:164 (-),score=70.71 TRINITY_DN9149_c0_g1_i1:114-605(-)